MSVYGAPVHVCAWVCLSASVCLCATASVCVCIDITLAFDLAQQRAVGRVVTTVAAPIATPERTLTLQAVHMHDVAVEGSGLLAWRYDGHAITLVRAPCVWLR
jgi:hypothetical protein